MKTTPLLTYIISQIRWRSLVGYLLMLMVVGMLVSWIIDDYDYLRYSLSTILTLLIWITIELFFDHYTYQVKYEKPLKSRLKKS